jgi:hypothetical protein
MGIYGKYKEIKVGLHQKISWVVKLCVLMLACGFQNASADADYSSISSLHRANPSAEYLAFIDKYTTSDRVDAYFFFADPLDYKGKAVLLDARFDKITAPGEAQFTIWRNFGKMRLLVSDIEEGVTIPKDKAVLIAGVITDFRNEVVSGSLVTVALIKYQGRYVCHNDRCDE